MGQVTKVRKTRPALLNPHAYGKWSKLFVVVHNSFLFVKPCCVIISDSFVCELWVWLHSWQRYFFVVIVGIMTKRLKALLLWLPRSKNLGSTCTLVTLLPSSIRRFTMIISAWWLWTNCTLTMEEVKLQTESLKNGQLLKRARIRPKKSAPLVFSWWEDKDVSTNIVIVSLVLAYCIVMLCIRLFLLHHNHCLCFNSTTFRFGESPPTPTSWLCIMLSNKNTSDDVINRWDFAKLVQFTHIEIMTCTRDSQSLCLDTKPQ